MTAPLTVADLLDAGRVAGMLAAGGMSAGAAADKAGIFVRCAESAGRESPGDAEAHALFVPGRVEVLGKHTDYGGGRSIVAVIERGLCVVAVPSAQPVWRAIAPDVGGKCDIPISPDVEPALGHWSNYPATVVRRVASNFPAARRGATVAYAGDLPLDAGMSSSSAVVTANLLAFLAVNNLWATEAYRREIRSREDLAGYLGTVENGRGFGSLAGDGGVGTFGGSEDHVAMLCSEPGSLAQYSYCPVRQERRIVLPEGLIFAIAVSGVAAAKTGSALEQYNRASRLATAALKAWNRAAGREDATLAAVLDGAAAEEVRDALARAGEVDGFSAGKLLERFEHFRRESGEIVPLAGDALAAGNLAEFARQVEASQDLAERMLHNQTPETAALAALARRAEAVAASAFGAGFGGSVWALVSADAAGDFVERWRTGYAEQFPAAAAKSAFFVTGAGPAAFELAKSGSRTVDRSAGMG